MLISMTACGEASCGVVQCELRSLNNRFFKTFISMPPFLSKYEHNIESTLRKKLLRGTVYCNILANSPPKGIIYDIETVKKYRDMLVSLKDSLNLKDEVTLEMLSRFDGVFKTDIDRSGIGKIWEDTDRALNRAIKELLKMRRDEGRKIEKDVKSRVKNLKGMLSDISKKIPERIKKEKVRLERLSCEEPMLVLERINVEEELSRTKFHISCMKEILKEKTSQGKKLLFLLQEILRETNTISSKIQDAPISSIVVDMKTEIESLREEIENVL